MTRGDDPNDPKKLAGAIAKLEAEYENDEAGEE